MTDEEIAAALFKRFIVEAPGVYFNWTESRFTLDGRVSISPEEAKALERITGGTTGGAWWES